MSGVKKTAPLTSPTKKTASSSSGSTSTNVSARSTGPTSSTMKGKTTQAQSQASNAAAAAEAETAARIAAEDEEAQRKAAEEQYYFEEVDVASDGEEPAEAFTEVPISPGDGEEEVDFEDDYGDAAAPPAEDYHTLVQSLKNTHTDSTLPPLAKSSSGKRIHAKSTSDPTSTSTITPSTPADQWLIRKLKVWKMMKTLEMFHAEWADLKDAGQLPTKEQIGSVPHEALTNHAERNESKIVELETALNKTGTIANQARESWEKLKRERDYHRMHHSRVLQEKEILIRDLKRLKKHYESFEPTLAAMKTKYEIAMKDKMMMRLERDRCKVKAEALEAQMKAWEQAAGNLNNAGEAKEEEAQGKKEKAATTEKIKKYNRSGHPKDTPLPGPESIRENPFLHTSFEPVMAHQFQLRKTFKGHRHAISGMCLHPKKSILCTVSDDQSWKMWSIPKGDLIMSGEGHKDWISSCEFHPQGNLLATASGDGTVKLWDFMKAVCSYTFAEHTQAVWDVAFHEQGDFFVSASMDHTSKLWDINSQRCRQTFRGHVDSVNSICFQPFTNNICTASGDKTVSLWDLRSGLCVQTFYGHQNAVTHASFNLSGDTIISSDADGVVKMWDVRLVGEKANFRSMGNQAVNEARIDRSGLIAALASDDGTIKIFSTADGKHLGDLEGHEDAVQSVLFDPNGQFLISASSDQTFRIWS